MGHVIGTLSALVMLAASASAPELKSTTKLTIIADARGLLEITAPEVLALSHVFAGQFIGAPAESPDSNFARYTVIFDIQTLGGVKHGAYAVQYVFDDSTGEAFVYLPGRGEPAYRSNASTMIRDGQDGRWHRASAEWAALIRAYLR
jgi:hypothetical protein